MSATNGWRPEGVIWTDSGQASAVIKDVITRTHSEIEVFGLSTRGFFLMDLPGE
ncbi:MAG: hypothetical protein NZ807_00130 [Dehalococcoidia bacterium]|nr:hypothetical protein [Dehalococcoidia bacterium]